MASIQAHRQGDVLTVVFSRPEAANAFSLDDAESLREILRLNKSAKVLIWRSAGGRFFCAGGDLAAYARLTTKAQGFQINKKISLALADLAKFPGVTLAIVEGDCFGGGVELLSCFDMVWSVPHAAFGLWQRRIGLSFGWGGGQRLAARLGQGRLRERALSGDSFTAFKASEFNLVDKILTPERIETELQRFCAHQLELAREPIVALKATNPRSEAAWFRRLWGNKSHLKALKPFRRVP